MISKGAPFTTTLVVLRSRHRHRGEREREKERERELKQKNLDKSNQFMLSGIWSFLFKVWKNRADTTVSPRCKSYLF